MSDAAALMDRMYRRQRHIYDLSRKYYLIGRDEAIARLRPGPGDCGLEIGCGTGRNLIRAARAYPDARFFGLDVSREMLDTAETAIRRAGLADRVVRRPGRRDRFRPSRSVRPRRFRAGDDLLRPLDDLHRGARRSPTRSMSSPPADPCISSILVTARVCRARSRRRCAAGSLLLT